MDNVVKFIAKKKPSAFLAGQNLANHISIAEGNATRRAILSGLVATLGHYDFSTLREIVETETQFRNNQYGKISLS